jgi:hypothetical protein
MLDAVEGDIKEFQKYLGVGVSNFEKTKTELEVLNTAEKTEPTPEAQKKIDDDSKNRSFFCGSSIILHYNWVRGIL